MKILVSGAAILAANVVEFPDCFISYLDGEEDRIIPKAIVPGAQLFDVAALPDGYVHGKFEWDGSGVVARPATPEEIASKASLIAAAADAKSRDVRDALVAGISPAEMASWPIKRAEAIAYQAAGVQATNADAPMLAIEAQARGISVAALAEKVLNKAQALSALEAAIAGRCGAIQDAARAARTLADLESINVQSGWPA